MVRFFSYKKYLEVLVEINVENVANFKKILKQT